MKANEAPDKVYFSTIDNGTHYYTEEIPFEREYIEYIRTDSFIEKACEWLKNNIEKYYYLDEAYDKVISTKKLNTDFKKYMED